MTRLMFVDGVLRVVIAAYPAGDWHQQRRLLAYLRRSRGHGTRSRKAGRILSSAALFEAGRALAEDEAPATRSPLFRATTLRDGAIIALLALMPMRRRALANLRIGESVFLSETRISIALPAELTKTGIPWEADVPDAARSILTLYLDEARPLLRARGTGSDPHLWLDRKGKGLRAATLGPGITAQVARMTGIRVPPHFFRDAAATTLARLSPQSARLIPPVLGHAGFATAEKHYVHAQSIDAGRDYAALIARRKELAR